MLERYRAYKITILILAVIILLESILLIYLWITRPKKIIKVTPEIKGKIAIVIDDWGYNLNNLGILEQINYPLTAAILPNLAYSKSVATTLHNQRVEVILHLPLEPHEKFNLEKNTILTSLDEQTIRNIVTQDLEDIYYAKGVSNHMGSKATEDYWVMSIIFGELKKRGLFFLDSLVSPKSVCPKAAHKMHLGFAKRDVFLDNQEEYNYIKRQIQQLKNKARIYGQAIGIGHDKKITLEVLKEVIPQLEKEGYKFVFLSELIK